MKRKAKLARIVGMAGKTKDTPSFLGFRNSGRADDTKCRLSGRMCTKNLLSQVLFLF